MATAAEWDAKFRAGSHVSADPDPFLAESRKYWPLIPGFGEPARTLTAIDVAAGAGRHAAVLAGAGFHVTAADFSQAGLDLAWRLAHSRGVDIETLCLDLEAPGADLGDNRHDLAAVFFFLHRPLFAVLKRCLRPGGLLVYKTYTVDQRAFPGRPSHPMYLLEHNELLRVFGDFRVLRYEEEWEGKGTAALVAQKPA